MATIRSTCSPPRSAPANGCKLPEESTIPRQPGIQSSNSSPLDTTLCISDVITQTDIVSPHLPPVPQPKFDRPPGAIRQEIIRNYQGYRVSNIRHYMEDRMVRWRPASSSHGTLDAINGAHPFQLQQDMSQPTRSDKITWIQRISFWWDSWTRPKIATQHSLGLSFVTSGRCNDNLETDNLGLCRCSAESTPLGIPLYDLTFDKEPAESQNNVQCHDLEEDIWSLGNGNFLTCCFYGKCLGW